MRPKISITILLISFAIGNWGIFLPQSAQLSAQQSPGSLELKSRMEAFEAHQASRESALFRNLNWQVVGPIQMTGRLTDVAAHPDQPETYYVASASGGVFKSTDDGKTWQAIFEDYPTASIGDLAIDPQNPDVIWVGTGEANILRSTMAGIGLFKSTDGGQSFEYVGLGETHHIARIVIHPQDSNIVYVAAPGNEYRHNAERGVYKTIDGGKTWEHIFFVDEATGSIDLAIDPQNPDILYMATAERKRLRWNDPRPGAQTGLWKSTDGGKQWRTTHRGLPDMTQCERIGIDVCLEQPNVVYALVNNLAANPAGRGVIGADLYRSDDHGESWTRCEGSPQIGRIYSSYGWFFGQVRVHPTNPDIVYTMGVQFMRTQDGGKTFENIRGSHADYHAMWFNPKNPDHILVGNDGGVMISKDGLATYEAPRNLPIAQMYNVALSNQRGKFYAYTCIQDNMGWRGLIDATDRQNVSFTPWERGYGDESGRHAVDPTNPDLVYAVNRYGTGPFRFDLTTEDRRNRRKEISPDFGSESRRAQWVSPLIISPHDHKRLLYGAQFVFVSDDQGDNWRRISDDLTNFDPDKQGNIAFSTIFSISESPLEKGLIYAGTDDGNLQVTEDEGKTWRKAPVAWPQDCCIASIEACHFDKDTVYIACNGKRINDFQTYLFRSNDRGNSWTEIANNIPQSIANVIKQDPSNPQVLYAGTDMGVYVSLNGGQHWQVLGTGLPTVYVHDIAIHHDESLMVIATHGRGGYLIDIKPIRTTAFLIAP